MFVFGKRVVLGRSLAELNQFFRNISRWRSTFLWSTMKAAFLFALLLPTVFGASVDIDSKIRARCALSPQLIDEIRGYQPIVDKIIAAAVSGSFAGNTYRRYALDRLWFFFPVIDKCINFLASRK